MSSYIKDTWEKRYYCIDDYFQDNQYGYVEMNEEEAKEKLWTVWTLLDFNTLEWRWWTRKVLKNIPVNNI